MNKDLVLELREAGMSYGEISKKLDMPRGKSSQSLKEAKNQNVSIVAKRFTKNQVTIA